MKSKYFKATFFVAFFFYTTCIFCQVFENQNSEVYNIIYRYAQKGLIEWNDIILPIDRASFKEALLKIKLQKDNLTKIEAKEIDFYLNEYLTEFNDKNPSESIYVLKKDENNRFRSLYLKNKEYSLFIDPTFGIEQNLYSNNKNSVNYFNGLRFWGYIGKNNKIGYNFFFRDVTEKGDSIDINRSFSPSQGFVNVARNSKESNYSNLTFSISYKWKNGLLSLGKENLNWGYGEFGKVILSSKAPSFVNIRLNYNPTKWLRFDYFHGWINSNLVDSNASSNNGSNIREVFINKFLASHSLTFLLKKGITFSAGESMIYSNRFDIGYMIPINFFKAYDQYSSNYRLYGGSNNQFFGQLSLRNVIKNTHIYGSVFIDEIRLSKILDKIESRNQVGYNIGISKTDFLLRYLTIGIDYTKIKGGVYNNIIEAQQYSNLGFSLGDWMGQNSDRLGFYLKLTPIPKLKINASYYILRKGKDFTINEQYFQQPEPGFLASQIFTQKRILFNVSYEFIHTLKLFMNYSNTNIQFAPQLDKSKISNISMGFTYGF